MNSTLSLHNITAIEATPKKWPGVKGIPGGYHSVVINVTDENGLSIAINLYCNLSKNAPIAIVMNPEEEMPC